MSGLIGSDPIEPLFRFYLYLAFSSVFIQRTFEAMVSHTLPIPVGYGLTALSAVGLKTLFLFIFYGKVRE